MNTHLHNDTREAILSRMCWACNTILSKLIVNRFPPKTLLWRQFPETIAPLLRGDSALDVGCGTGSRLPFEGKQWFGVDIHFPSLLSAREKHNYAGLVCADIRQIAQVFEVKSIASVVAIDLVEHLDKRQATSLIRIMESLARCRVVILVPNGHVDQDATVVATNPWMQHRSSWSAAEMQDLGYQVRGYSGWKACAGHRGWIRRRLDALFQIMMTVSQPIVENRPRWAFHLLCWKDVGEWER